MQIHNLKCLNNFKFKPKNFLVKKKKTFYLKLNLFKNFNNKNFNLFSLSEW